MLDLFPGPLIYGTAEVQKLPPLWVLLLVSNFVVNVRVNVFEQRLYLRRRFNSILMIDFFCPIFPLFSSGEIT
jgi:hypothetical protein